MVCNEPQSAPITQRHVINISHCADSSCSMKKSNRLIVLSSFFPSLIYLKQTNKKISITLELPTEGEGGVGKKKKV